MATQNRRHQWRQVKGKWTRSFGERGLRVRLFQNEVGGVFFQVGQVAARHEEGLYNPQGREEMHMSRVSTRVSLPASRRF
jgi:hypothetical protein